MRHDTHCDPCSVAEDREIVELDRRSISEDVALLALMGGLKASDSPKNGERDEVDHSAQERRRSNGQTHATKG